MRVLSLVRVLPLAAFAVAFAMTSSAQGQVESAPAPAPHRELAFDYSYVNSNLPPGGCGCFGMNGGSVQLAVPLMGSSFSFAADFTIASQSSAASSSNSLTLSSYTAGARYRPKLKSSVQPFGEVLAGFSHASGTLVASPLPASANAGIAFASLVGGGLDIRMNPRVSLRVVQADYYVTTFDNGTNNHQNNLRLGAGVVVHF
jgi:peptidoglycan-associated lipoprotein